MSSSNKKIDFESSLKELESIVKKLEDENINSPIILGHSMGGKAALMFTEKYPKYVDKLVVADIGTKAYPMHHDDILKGLNSVNLQEITSRTQAQQSIQVHIDNLGVQQFLLKNLYWIEKGKLAWRMNLKDIEKNIGEILAMRDLMHDLRAADPFRQSAGKSFSKNDRSNFLNGLERLARIKV